MKCRKGRATTLYVATLVLLLSACTGAPKMPAELATLPECGLLPNCVNTQSGKGIHAAQPLTGNARKWLALKEWLAQQADWTIVSEGEDFMQLTVKTPGMGFTDDVQLQFDPAKQLIQVRSSSRLGLSDLGTNARRVEMLRKQLAALD